MEIACPYCGKRYQVKSEVAGRKARCANPACKRTFIVSVPGPGTGQPAATPQVAPQVPLGESGLAGGASGLPSAGPLDALLAAELGPPAVPGVAGPAMPGQWTVPGARAGAAPSGLAPFGPSLIAWRYRRRRQKWVRAALLAGGIAAGLAGLILVGVLVGRAFRGPGVVASMAGDSGTAANGLPAWAAFAVPSGAKAIAYANVDKIRQSEVLRVIEGFASKRPGASPLNLQARITPLKDIFFVGSLQASVAVIRTRDDLSLETLQAVLFSAKPGQSAPPSKFVTHGGISYVALPTGCIAKLASCTYCATEREEELKQALDRYQRGEAAPLEAELQEALKNAPSGDHFLVSITSGWQQGMLPRPAATEQFKEDIRWVAVALSVDSSIRASLTAEFTSSDKAAQFKSEFDILRQMMSTNLAKAPPQIRPKTEKIQRLISGLSVSASGTRGYVKFRCAVRDIEELGKLLP